MRAQETQTRTRTPFKCAPSRGKVRLGRTGQIFLSSNMPRCQRVNAFSPPVDDGSMAPFAMKTLIQLELRIERSSQREAKTWGGYKP